MSVALPASSALPWGRRDADERRYVRIQTATLGLVMMLAAVIPHLPVFLEQLAPPEEPIPVVKLRLLPRPPAPPRPQGGGATVKPEPAPARTAVSAPRPAAAAARQPPSPEAARQRAARAGVLSATRELAELQNSAVLTRIQSDRPLIGAVSATPSDNPEILVAGAEQSSGGISTTGIGQSSGGNTVLGEGSTGSSIGRGTAAGGSGTGDGGGSGGSGGSGSYQPGRTAESIQLVFDRNKAAFEALYQRALRQNPALQGKVVFEITIQPSGRISACRIHSSELNDPVLEAKLVGRVQLLDFGAEDVPALTRQYPMRFYPR